MKKAARMCACAAAFSLLVIVSMAGCVSPAALHRKNLSDPIMRPDYDKTGSTLDNHIYERREGSSGGSVPSGGGCGC
jgi:hypothetical protein